MRPYILAETNWKALKDEEIDLAVLPWGATEAHNYHLPYGTDNIESDAIAAEAAKIAWEEGTKAIVLPCLPFGVNTGQHDIKLDINLNPSTQLAILSDIIEVLNRQGIFKLLVLNSHGGNDFKTLLRELGLKYPKMMLVSCMSLKVAEPSLYFEEPGDHAGELETSLLLHLRPELVRPLKEAGPGRENKSRLKGIREGWAWSERQWSMVTDDTGIGDPSRASKEKGEKFFAAVTLELAGLFTELAQVEINDRYER